MFFNICSRLTAAIGAALLLALSATAKPGSKTSADQMDGLVELSPFEVTARSMEFDNWSKISSPHFVIYTDASTKTATELLKKMEMLHEAVQFYLRRKAIKLEPLIVVLPTTRSDWRKLASKGGVEWKVGASVLGLSRKLLLVEEDWQSTGLRSVWALIADHTISALNLDGPFWFGRGMMSFFETAEFKGDTLTIGKEGSKRYWIQTYGWLNWPKFFGITWSSPEFRKDGNDYFRFEAQCGVFVHYLLTNPEPVWTARLLTWSALMDAGQTPSEENFTETFGENFSRWEERLGNLLNGGKYTTGTIRFPPTALQFPIENTDLPASEMRELFVLCQILNRRGKESSESLEKLLARPFKSDSLRELLADACERRGRPDDALAQLQSIIAAGTKNPVVYLRAGRILYDRAIPKTEVDARLGTEEEQIRIWCKKALEIEPLHLQTNVLLAWTEALAPAVQQQNVDSLIRICRTLDGHAPTDSCLTALAVARWRTGGVKQVRTICERLIASPLCGKTQRAIAEELLVRLNAQTHPEAGDITPASPTPAGSGFQNQQSG